jgi:single-strand DNA-binding protein
MFQKITIVGRLGRDPESSKTQAGADVCSFSIASDRGYTDRSGARQKETTWFRVNVYDAQAAIAAKYLRKGKLVLVEGRLRVDAATGGPRVYQKKDGTHGSSFEIDCLLMRMLSPAEGVQEPEDVPF